MHSEEVSSEGSLAESLSCAKECGRRPHAILVAEPLKLIKPMQHPGRSGISHRRSRCIVKCQRHQGLGDTNCCGLDGESRKTVRAFFVVFGGQHCRLREDGRGLVRRLDNRQNYSRRPSRLPKQTRRSSTFAQAVARKSPAQERAGLKVVSRLIPRRAHTNSGPHCAKASFFGRTARAVPKNFRTAD
jgi:hypothetical protein